MKLLELEPSPLEIKLLELEPSQRQPALNAAAQFVAQLMGGQREARRLAHWISTIDPQELHKLLARYAIDPATVLPA